MSRDLSPGVLAAISAETVRPCLFFEGQFATGYLRVWTGLGDILWNGFTWTGAGNLVGLSPIEESTDVAAQGVTVSLSGVPAAYVALALSEARQGMPGRIWLGFVDPAGIVIDSPFQSFAGRLDVPEVADGAETCVIRITYESRLLDLMKPREWRYTDQSQQALHPGDRAFEYVAGLQEKPITWGRA
jgi:hypothetical protein